MAREPRVLTEDVGRALRGVIRPDDPDEGEAVSRLADRARTSARTVYRVLSPPPRTDGTPHRISLDLADRLCLAAGCQLASIGARLWIDGDVVEYLDA